MIDTSHVDTLAQILTNRGLTRLRVEEGDQVIELECAVSSIPEGLLTQIQSAPPKGEIISSVDAQAVATGESTAPTAAEEPLDVSKLTVVRAPMVGVFYAAPSPGAEPFVHVGSQVRKGDTLCIIEAMKLMNEVVAEKDGEVVDICVEDGELVEFGGTLMKLYEEGQREPSRD